MKLISTRNLKQQFLRFDFGLRLQMLTFVVVTLLYVVVTPPFQVRDEPNHFFKAYYLSEGGILSLRINDSLGADLPTSVGDMVNQRFPAEGALPGHKYRLLDIVSAWSQSDDFDRRQFTPFSYIASYSPTLYAPQAFGISIARGFGVSTLGQFYAGRLFNAGVGIMLVIGAIVLMPFGRGVMMAFAAFPMVSYQIGSLSADAMIIGLSFFTLAYTLRLATCATLPRWAVLWPGLLSLLALAKGVYLPIALAGFAIKPWRTWYVVALLLSLMIAFVVALEWLKYNSGNFIRQSFIGRYSLIHMQSALPSEQISYVVNHPFLFFKILTESFVSRMPVYAVDAIGRFGWFTVMLPIPIYVIAVISATLAVASPSVLKVRILGWTRLFWGTIVLGICLLIEAALYLTATQFGANYVEGVQGRYFIPLLPLLGIALLCPLNGSKAVGRLVQKCLTPTVLTLMFGGLITNLMSYWLI